MGGSEQKHISAQEASDQMSEPTQTRRTMAEKIWIIHSQILERDPLGDCRTSA